MFHNYIYFLFDSVLINFVFLKYYKLTFFKRELVKAQKIKVLDKESFEKLFRDYFKPLVAFANKYVSDVDTAKDIVHDVFIKLWEKKFLMDLNKSPKSYLYTSVNNRSLNFIRDNKKYIQNKVSYENIDVGGNSDFSDNITSNEIELKINQTLDKLPKKCRRVFIMSRYEDLKYKGRLSTSTIEQIMTAVEESERIEEPYKGWIIGY